MNRNPLISKHGFEYLFSLIKAESVSKTHLEQVLSSLVENNELSINDYSISRKKSKSRRIKLARKEDQVTGVVELIKALGEYKEITDIASGSGKLTARIAESFQDTIVRGIEANENLVRKASTNYGTLENLSFKEADCFSYSVDNPGLIISLHGCGDISDRVIDIAIESESDVLCVPCCYTKMKRKDPVSKTLRNKKEFFSKEILDRVIYLEGHVRDGKPTGERIVREVYRVLLNYDRLFHLMEQGYNVKLERITGKEVRNNGETHLNSSLRLAISGKKN